MSKGRPAVPLALTVLVPTYQRPAMLARTLESLLSAPVPDALAVRIVAIQNDTSADTTAVIDRFCATHPATVSALHEPRSGKARAINSALAATTSDLVGIIDDDEEIDSGWYRAVAREFSNPRVAFIGGPCVPRWEAAPPAWLPPRWSGAIGSVDDGDRVRVFGEDASGILMGGNAVMRRTALDRAGWYALRLGPRADRRLLSGEDEDLYHRLLATGAYGLYIPDLRIHHYVPVARMTKRYHRRWSFWNGVARSLIDRTRPLPVRRLGRVPRFLYGAAVRSAVRGSFAGDAGVRFGHELDLWHLAGFLYGNYVYDPEPA